MQTKAYSLAGSLLLGGAADAVLAPRPGNGHIHDRELLRARVRYDFSPKPSYPRIYSGAGSIASRRWANGVCRSAADDSLDALPSGGKRQGSRNATKQRLGR